MIEKRTHKRLTEEQEIFVTEHHLSMTVNEIREAMGMVHANSIYFFMRKKVLSTLDRRIGRSNGKNRSVPDGCFDVDSRFNWAI